MAGALPPFALPEDDHDRDELLELWRRLGEEEPARGARIAVCEVIAAGLARVGQVLWVSGAIVGPHRVSGESRHGFGDDRVVGVATVAQIGGELARGSIDLLRSGNRYAAAALVRQLLEVEYLRMRSRGSMNRRRRGCAPIASSAVRSGPPRRFVLGRTARSSASTTGRIVIAAVIRRPRG